MSIAGTKIQRFIYSARDQNGAMTEGALAAASVEDASRSIRAEGKFVVRIKPAKAEVAPGQSALPAFLSPRVKREDLIHFTVQLSVMTDTGVPISEALQSLADQCTSEGFRPALTALVADVQSGVPISNAMEKFPRIFPNYYVSLVRASEVSGTTSTVLRRLADYLTSQHETVKKVRGALIYPAFMMVMTIAVTIFLLAFVLPRFTAIFAARKAALPAPTRLLLAVSGNVVGHWVLYVVGSAAAIAFLTWFRRRPQGRRVVHYLQLHVPILRRMFRMLYLSRSLQTLATMLQSGVPLLDGLAIVREVAGNLYYQQLWDDVNRALETGKTLSEPLKRSPLIPPSIAQMVASGEKSGRLGQVLQRVSGFMEDDLRAIIKTSTQMIEPIMICVMGAIIGTVAIAMLLPIMTISKVMAK